jgi:hypothetical protein
MKKYYRQIHIFTVCIFLIGAACYKNPIELDDNSSKTLASLQKVDDFPLYVMHFYGDYDSPLSDNYVIPNKTMPLQNREKWACTCFAGLNPSSMPLLGRNFDWYDHPALLLFTDPPDKYASVSMVDMSYLGYSKENLPQSNPARLLEAPYLPFDGLNECGLAIGMMAVPYAQASSDPGKKTIGSLTAIRIMLDYAKDVDQAVDLLQQFNISFAGGPPVHYIVSDSSGNSVVIEFLDGNMQILNCEKSWQVATNFILTGMSEQDAPLACWRYARVWNVLEANSREINLEAAMSLLSDVSQSNTIWSVVYDMDSFNIKVAMGKKYNEVHSFNLNP